MQCPGEFCACRGILAWSRVSGGPIGLSSWSRLCNLQQRFRSAHWPTFPTDHAISNTNWGRGGRLPFFPNSPQIVAFRIIPTSPSVSHRPPNLFAQRTYLPSTILRTVFKRCYGRWPHSHKGLGIEGLNFSNWRHAVHRLWPSDSTGGEGTAKRLKSYPADSGEARRVCRRGGHFQAC